MYKICGNLSVHPWESKYISQIFIFISGDSKLTSSLADWSSLFQDKKGINLISDVARVTFIKKNKFSVAAKAKVSSNYLSSYCLRPKAKDLGITRVLVVVLVGFFVSKSHATSLSAFLFFYFFLFFLSFFLFFLSF